MTDIASIGFKMETDDVARGIKSLEALAQQGPKVEKALDGVEKTVSKTSKSLKTLGEGAGKGLDEVGRSAPRAAEGVGRVAKSADDAKVALAGIKQSAAGLASVSSSATQAARGLSGFAGGAKSAHAAMAEMQAAIRNASQGVSTMAAEMAKLPATLQATAKAQEQAAKSAVDMAQALKQTTDQARAYASASSNIADASQKTAKSMDATASAARAMASVLAVAGVGFGANELIAMVDGYTKYTAQLKLATKSTTDQAVAMASVKRIATDAQQVLGEVGTLYARIANGTAELGLSQSKLANITETVALSLKVSGAAASESSSAMLQLSQAFASGVLRGEEFNSVNEAAPRLMKALADGLNVPIGALRKMAEEGKLTSAVLAEALPKALGQLREEAKSVQNISGAFTVLKNNIMEMVGAQSNASGTTKALASGINSLANNLDLVATAGGAVALVFAGRLIGSMNMFQAATIASTAATVRHQIATTAMAASISASSTAMALASRGAAGAVGLLGGPLGAVITVAGLAATAFYAFGSSAGNLAKEIGGLNQPLDDLKRKIDALPSEKRVAVILDIKEEAAKKAKEAEASFDDLAAAMVGAFSGARAASADSAKQVNNLVDKLDAAKKTGADMTPILRDAAKAAGVSNSTLKSWLDLAANIRSARDAAKAGDQVSDVIGAGGGRGTVNPSTVGQIAESARTQAKTALEATKAYQSQAEQMAKVRTEGDSLRTALKALEQSNQGAGASADQLRERIKGVDERLASLAKRGQSGASSVKAEQTAYASLVASLDAKIAANAEELKYGKQLTESDKLRIKLMAEINSGSKRLTEGHKAEALSKLKVLGLQEQEQEYRDNYLRGMEAERKLRLEAATTAEKSAESLTSGNKSLREEIELIGLSADQQLAVNRARLEAQILVKEQHLAEMQRANDAVGFMSREQIALEEQIRLLKERLSLTSDKHVLEAAAKSAEAVTRAHERGNEQIQQSLTDALMAGGKSGADYIEDLFRTMVLRPAVQYGANSLMGAVGLGQQGNAVSSVLGGGNVGTTVLNNAGLIGAGAQAIWGASVGASSASLLGANAVGMMGGDALGALIAGNGGWAGVAVEAGAAAGAAAGASAISAGLTLGTGASVGSAAAGLTVGAGYGVGATAGAGAAAGAGGLTAGLAAIPGWGWAAMAALAVLGSGAFGSNPKEHAGGVYSNTASRDGTLDKLGLTRHARGDFTERGNAVVDGALATTINGLLSAYEGLAKRATGVAAQLDVYAAFATNPISTDQDAYGYLSILDKVTGEYLRSVSYRDGDGLGNDPAAAFSKFGGQIVGEMVEQLKLADIPGWMSGVFDSLGSEITLDGFNAALQQIALIDAGFLSLERNMSEFAGLSSEMQTALINVSGGFDAMMSNAGSYRENFYSEPERMEILSKQVQDALSSLDISLDPRLGQQAKDEFRRAVEAAKEGGQGELMGQLLVLNTSFATAADYAQKVAEAAGTAGDELADLGVTLSDVMLDLLGQRKSLDAELLRAQGDDAGYAAAKRAIAIEGYTEAEAAAWDYNTALQGQIDALDAAAAAATAAAQAEEQRIAKEQALNVQLLRAQGDSFSAQSLERANELAALRAVSATAVDYQQQLWAIADAQSAAATAEAAQKAAQDSAYANLQAAVNREKEYWQSIASASQTAVSSLSSTLNLLTSNARDLYGTVDSAAQWQAAAGMVYIEDALEAVLGGASITGYTGLSDAVTAARSGISNGAYATQFDKDRDALVLAGQLSALGELTDSQLTVEERTLRAAQEQIDQLTKTLQFWQEQIDGTHTLIDKTMSVEQAVQLLSASLAGFALQMSTAMSAQAAIQAAASSVPTSPINEYGSHTGIGDSGYQLVGNTLYFPGGGSHSVSGPDGVQLLLDTYGLEKGGPNGSLIRTRAGGGYTPPGLTWVGEEGPELVNFRAPSMVYTAAQSANLMGGNTERLEQLLGTLVDENRAQAREIVRLNAKVARVLDRWETGGLPRERKEAAV